MRKAIGLAVRLTVLWAGLTGSGAAAQGRPASHAASAESGPFDPIGTISLEALSDAPGESAGRPRNSTGFGGPGGSRVPGVSTIWHPAQAFGNAPGDLELLRQQLNIGGPVYRGDGDTTILAVRASHLRLGSSALFPDSGEPLPQHLWDISFNANHRHEFDNGWTGTLLLGLGSASDRPFESVDELLVTAGGVLRIPTQADRDAWVLSLMYLPASTLNFPVPGVAYDWHPSDDFHLRIGVPFSLYWRPRPDVTVEGAYLPLTNIRARITWQLLEPLSLFSSYDWQTEAYFLAGRSDVDDRLMLFEQRVAAGLTWDFATHAAFSLQGGWALDRSLGRGRNQGDSLRDELEVESGPFLEAAITIRW